MFNFSLRKLGNYHSIFSYTLQQKAPQDFVMSDFSLTLVLHFKTSKNFNGMAKVIIKSEKITPFGGIFLVREHFSRFVGPVINKVLGLRCTSFGYQSARLWVLCQVSTSVAATVWRNNGFGWARLPKSFMAENTVFLMLTALIRNFYKFLMDRIDAKAFGLKISEPFCIH